ncbi:carboxylating nicotinate-nucleotide diphosphorylase [Pseudobacteriovorax antillogorgiicola]|uniref:Probable nicotinate-nucleotide pyrophosphorylase [carboxylating] n=1 Tax=Pseudobacteriovorax antillogorgiicola TaxID=1513793 RepID=A0A1Y6BCA7_9BACT|nr:carboxylating nicotinate-nucleotide diphosphorylase [Pseudobacteriovorax antillogorgiicola]TCS58568.1 nicotinate-nucleotide pyrophosphorylase [carboxylating] [Pseudobacteriovorax antillogorgiicola]SME97431.1 nicotinate-nucleotide pyrophosphorylase [carboxylating] [Pseudobacteriovorax antillogorgiicola]
MHELHAIQLDPIISRALEEDWGYGDWTTDICVGSDKFSSAKIIAKEECIACGMDVARAVFLKVDPSLDVQIKVENGQALSNRQTMMEISGRARSILKGERVALNLMGRMCGIASITREFVSQLEGTRTQLLDTRKTTPGLRILEKFATVVGGARNHRFGLCDGVIVKENHIRAAGGIKAAVSSLLESLPPTIKVEVETTNQDEVQEAIEAGADIIMLDNMSPEAMKQAVAFVNGRALLEASGNVRISNIKEVASTGVDFVSTSAIIHSARWSDLSLLFDLQ